MGEGVVAALVTGVLSLTGVIITLASRRTSADEVQKREVQKLRAELAQAQLAVTQLRGESERLKAAYSGLLDLTQGLLEEKA